MEAFPNCSKFRIINNQQSLKHLVSRSFQAPDEHKWVTKLHGFTFDIIYRPDCKNTDVDALSRHIDPKNTSFVLLTIFSPFPTLLNDLYHYHAHHPDGLPLVQKNTTDQSTPPKFILNNGLMFFQQRFFLPDVNDFRQITLQELHSTLMAGHPIIHATIGQASISMSRLMSTFAWALLVPLWSAPTSLA